MVSQPAAADRPLPEPGWYADPLDAARERFWDGTAWTTGLRSLTPAAGLPIGQPQAGRGHAPRIAGRPVPRTTDGVRLAGWWSRFGATLVDGLIILALTLVASAPLLPGFWDACRVWYADAHRAVLMGGQPTPFTDERYGVAGTYTLMFLINRGVGLAYGTALQCFAGATLGMRMLGLRVVRFGRGRTTGGLPLAGALVRNLVFQLAGWLWIAQLANCLWPLFNADRQALHDIAARTQVIDIARRAG